MANPTTFQDLGLDQISFQHLLINKAFFIEREHFLSNPPLWVDKTHASIQPSKHSPSGFELVEVKGQMLTWPCVNFSKLKCSLGQKLGHIVHFHLENGDKAFSKNHLKYLAKIEQKGNLLKIIETKLAIFFNAGGKIFLDHIQVPNCPMLNHNWRIQWVTSLILDK